MDNEVKYKPVILIHGILVNSTSMEELVDFIDKFHPGTVVHNVNLFPRLDSFTPMWNQLDELEHALKKIFEKSKNGVHLIGYSQGGLLGRGIVQTFLNHNVCNFISLGAPLNGQFGDTDFLEKTLPISFEKILHHFFYSVAGQAVSVGNYWKDPFQEGGYRKFSRFLAPLNDETSSPTFLFPEEWKHCMKRLHNLVLIAGPDDGIISPWQSSHFGCFDVDKNVIPMRKLKIYKEDIFGLKTLDKAGRLHEYTVPNITHTEWNSNERIFREYVLPWLD